MESIEINYLINDGLLRLYLSKRLSQEVIVAYNKTFGDVQLLATEHNMLDVICRRLENANNQERVLFWKYLNENETNIKTEPNRQSIWHKIKNWIKGDS